MEINIVDYFKNLSALVPLVVLITDFLIRWLKVEKGWIKQALSWGISLLLCGAGVWFDIGMFVDLPIGYLLVYGIAAGLVSNGIFDIKVVQMLLDFVLQFIPKKE